MRIITILLLSMTLVLSYSLVYAFIEVVGQHEPNTIEHHVMRLNALFTNT